MSHEQAAQLAGSWGIVLLAALFGIAVIYALWPGNRLKFKDAASAPLNHGDDDDH